MNTPEHVVRPRTAFASDNVTGASPEVIAALVAANAGDASPYGADIWSRRVEQKLGEIFEREVSAFLVSTGTAANALSLGLTTAPWGGVLCHPESHINNDECGAPEFYTDGAKLIPVSGAAAKIDIEELDRSARRKVGDVHSIQPCAVSITQATEVGSVYTVAEVAEIGAICRTHKLRLHMDGARFANALVTLGCSAAEMTWKAGVDVLAFGATKNGVLAADLIVVFDRELAATAGYRRKRGGHLVSKMRFLSAQMDAYLADDLWLRNAGQANAMATRLEEGLRRIPQAELFGRTEANILFCRLPARAIETLLAQGFTFYHDRWGPQVVRLITSFQTMPEDIDGLLAAIGTACT